MVAKTLTYSLNCSRAVSISIKFEVSFTDENFSESWSARTPRSIWRAFRNSWRNLGSPEGTRKSPKRNLSLLKELQRFQITKGVSSMLREFQESVENLPKKFQKHPENHEGLWIMSSTRKESQESREACLVSTVVSHPMKLESNHSFLLELFQPMWYLSWWGRASDSPSFYFPSLGLPGLF